MKTHMTTVALALASVSAFGQMSGVSHPDAAPITSDDAAPAVTQPVAASKPSAAISTAGASTGTSSASTVVYGAYVPYTGPTVPGSAVADVDTTPADVDAGIVTSVPEQEGTLREGTLLKTQIREMLSTSSTAEGTPFTAELTEPIERNGQVILPVGAVLEGRVTEVHGGKRITGAAALHLETRDIVLPDGTHYVVHAQLVDVGHGEFRIDDEGTLKRKDHVKEELAVAGGVTGAGAVTGALIGGGVGAAVGAGIGAGVSTVLWLKQDRQATLPKAEPLVFSLTTPMILTPLSNTPGAGLAVHPSGGGSQ